MQTLSELVSKKSVQQAHREYKNSEESKSLEERDIALSIYYKGLENAVLTDLQESFIEEVQMAAYTRDVDDLNRALNYVGVAITYNEFVALRRLVKRSVEKEDYEWFLSRLNSIIKQEALAKGRLDVVAKVLERETKPSRASEVKVIAMELLEPFCKSSIDAVMLNKKVREVIDTSLTEYERTYALAFLEAIENKDFVLLDNAIKLGENTLQDDVRLWVYSITTTVLNKQQDQWLVDAFNRLGVLVLD